MDLAVEKLEKFSYSLSVETSVCDILDTLIACC